MADMQDFLSLAPLVWAPADTVWNFLSRVTIRGLNDSNDTREKQRLLCERNGKNEITCRKAPLTDRTDRSSIKHTWQPQPQQEEPSPRGTALQGLPARNSRATGPMARMLERAVSSPSAHILDTVASKPQALGGKLLDTPVAAARQATGRSEGNVVAITAPKQAPSNQHLTERARLVEQPKQDFAQAAINKPIAVRSWDEAEWERVKKLQEAKRNSGCVDLMRSLESGRFVAVKRMPTEWVCSSATEFSNKYPRSTERPWVDIGVTTFLHSIGYPHVCEPLGVFADGVDTYVVSEFASSGDLFTWCHKQKAPPGLEREALIRPLVQQVCLAVNWLHECGIAHRDLSLENLVLTRNKGGGQLEVKLIDFGMATLQRTCRCEVCGKPSYQAPEIHGDGLYDTFLADSFALGVTFYCMASGDYPWLNTRPGAESDAIFRYVMANGLDKYFEARKIRGKGKRLVEVFSPELVHFLKCLMAPDPSNRITLRQLFPEMLETGWLSQE